METYQILVSDQQPNQGPFEHLLLKEDAQDWKSTSPLPSNGTVSSRTLKSVIPFVHKNFAARLVPAEKMNFNMA